MKKVYAVILAAGEGTRMKSSLTKVLHPVCGLPMVEHAMAAVGEDCEKPVIVIGHGGDAVREQIGERAYYAVQEKRLGTGHAVMMAREYLEGKDGYVVVMAGDMPLIHREIIHALIQDAMAEECGAVVLTGRLQNPTGYGRIIRARDGSIQAIIEEKDANDQQRKVEEVNSSIYCFDIALLLSCLDKLTNNNAQGEYYLTDCIEMIAAGGKKVRAHCVEDVTDCMGVNDRIQLSIANKVMRRRIITRHMQNGVTFIDPENAYVDAGVSIGNDTVIYPGVVLEGNTEIGAGCTITSGTRIIDSVVGDGVLIKSSELEQCIVKDHGKIGPFVHIRPDSVIGEGCKLGNFVEVKNSVLGKETKVSHLTYVGDSDVGGNVNVGCGVVFVNYDGAKKHRSTVGDGVFIGCNTNLVAPVTVGDGAYIAAGSTITEDIPENQLAIARARQINKPDWKRKK